MKNYDKNKESSYIQYLDANNFYGWAMYQKLPKNGFEWINDVTEMKRIKIDKCKKLVCYLHKKKKYFVHIRSLKQALNHGLKLKKVHKMIEYNQEEWLKPYIDIKTKLRKIAKNDFEKDFSLN